MRNPVSTLLSSSALALSVLFVGCESPHSRRHAREDRNPGPPRVAMRGEASFFEGTVKAEVTLSAGRPPIDVADSEDDTSHKGGHGGGGGGHGGHGGGGGGGRRGGGQRPEETDTGSEEESRGPAMRPIGMPALTLRLKLENTTTETVEILIHDVVSDLGNFAVRPERLTLAPKSAAEVDPMVSQLGAMADELPVKVVLRTQGRTETQIVVVKAIPPTPPPVPALTPAPAPAP